MMGSGGMDDMDMDVAMGSVLEMFEEFVTELLGASEEDIAQLTDMVEEMIEEADFESVTEMLQSEASFMGALMQDDEAVQALCGAIDLMSGMDVDIDMDMDDGGAEEVDVGGAEEVMVSESSEDGLRRRLPGGRGPGKKAAAVVGVVRGFEAVARKRMGPRGPPGPPRRPGPPGPPRGPAGEAGLLAGVQGMAERLGEAVQAFVGRCEAMTSAELESVEAGIVEFVEGAAEALMEASEEESAEPEAAAA